MKRMILVPEDAYARFEQKQKLETSPIIKNMINTDTDMTNILQRTDVDDTEKQKMYNANLERYLNLRPQKDSEIPTIRIAPSAENEEEPTNPKNAQLSDEVIVKHIPKTMQSRATAILNRLKERPDVITWAKTGEVKLEGENIPQSNISDLISDALRARKNFNPTGSKEFFRVLSKINMPKDLVRNEERWKESRMDRSFSEEGSLLDSPGASTSSLYFQNLLKRRDEKASKPKQTQERWLKY